MHHQLGKTKSSTSNEESGQIFNKKDIPWVELVWEKHYKNGKLPGSTKKGSFWWRDTLKLLHKLKELAQIQIKNGKTCLFRNDQWSSQTLIEHYPQANSFAMNKIITVHSAFCQEDFTSLFNLPLSQMAFQQVNQIQQQMSTRAINYHDNDI